MTRLRDFPIRWKLLLAVGTILAVVAVQSVTAYRSTVRSLETADWVEHTHRVIGLANETLAALVNMETGYRGFLITGTEAFLEPYTEGKRVYQERLQALQKETADNPAQVRRWQEIERRAAAWQQVVTEPGMRLRREVSAGRASADELAKFEASGEGKKHFDGIRSVVAEAVNAEQALLAERTRQNEAAAHFLLQLLLWGTLAVVGFGVGVALLLARLVARPLGAAVRVLERVGAGDFTETLDVEGQDEVGRMATALNEAIRRVRATLADVSRAADHVATAAQQLSAAAEELSAGAQQQASSLEETAASLEEITGTVKQNADNARQASQVAAGSRETAERGGQVVAGAVAAMGEINEASRRIADIITTIDEIAFQTNLLALNAAVEAARAGEQGRGFAVVAAEVRNLAQRSATYAREIKALIQDSVAKVEAGTGLVNESGRTLEEIVTSVKRVTDLIADIAAASQEQSTGIEQVNRAVSQMDQVVQTNSAQTEELSSTAQALSAQAQQLQALVARFRLGEAAERRPAAPALGPAAPRPRRARPTAPAAPGAVPPAHAPAPAAEPELVGAGVGRGYQAAGFEEF